MLKRKGDITSIETPPHFNPIVFSTNKSAADRINSIASFLLNDVEDMEHHISIESGSKTVEITVSVGTQKPDKDKSIIGDDPQV